MASISITLSAEQISRVRAAIRQKYAALPDVGTMTDTALAQKFLTDTLRDLVLTQECSQAENTLLSSLNKEF